MIYINRLGKVIECEDADTFVYINRTDEGFGENFYIFTSKHEHFKGEAFDDWVQNETELLAFFHQFKWKVDWFDGADINPGQNRFPENWTSAKILEVLQDAYTSPKLRWTMIEEKGFSIYSRSDRFYSHFIKEKVEIKVVIEPQGGGMITAYPLRM